MTDRFSRICGKDRVSHARLVLLFALFFMFFLFPGTSRAWATDYEFNVNSESIIVKESGQQNEAVATGGGRADANIIPGDVIIIKGTSGQNTITVQGGVSVKIKLDGVDIDLSNTGGTPCAFEIKGNSTVDLTLSGDNTLKSSVGKAGLQVESGNKLTICGKNADKLTATSSQHGAGIGGGYQRSGGDITITGGTVKTIGGSNSAGIGGGAMASGGNVTISGGTVTATGSDWGAGIGGGYMGSGGNIVISGGTVNATGGQFGAGIGGGNMGDSGNSVISGGTVTVTGGDWGAGIGGGYGGSGGVVTISGGTVTATGGTDGMDIGPGKFGGGNLDTITITGGSVHPTNGAGNVNPQPTNTLNDVYLNTLTVGSSSFMNKLITACTVDGNPTAYGINDVRTDGAGKVYFWLPGNPTGGNVTVSAEGNRYGKNYLRHTTGITETLTLIPTPHPDPGPVPVTGVTLTMQNMALSVGQTGTLRATITPNGATDKGLIWSSENPEIASVSENGVVRGLTPGKTTITVKTKDGGFTATCLVTVTEAGGEIEIEIDLSALKLDNGILRLLRGQSVDVTVTSDPTGAAFTADGLPDGLTISLQGRLSGVPDEPGRWLVVLTAALPDGTTAEAAFIIIVSDTQDNGSSSGGCATGAAGAIAALALAVIVLTSRGCRRRSKIRA